MATHALLLFGQKVVSRDEYDGREDIDVGVLGGIIWFGLAGWWQALRNLIAALVQ